MDTPGGCFAQRSRGGGLPPYEFVRSCRRAGAQFALFVRDPTRCWYCRGLGEGPPDLGHGASHSFEELVAVLRSEVRRVILLMAGEVTSMFISC